MLAFIRITVVTVSFHSNGILDYNKQDLLQPYGLSRINRGIMARESVSKIVGMCLGSIFGINSEKPNTHLA